MSSQWKEHLESKLIERYGKKQGLSLSKKYSGGFPHSYLDEYTPEVAVDDIDLMEQITLDHPLQISFYYSPKKKLHLRLYQWQKPIPLSDILPMLENLDLRVDSEHPYEITLKDKSVWISDFVVIYSKRTFEIHKLTELFEEAFSNVYVGDLENDGLNKLVLGASLSWREITMLRTYAKYLHQVGFRFSQAYIEKVLLNNTKITKQLVELFKTLHDPKIPGDRLIKAEEIKQQILKALESVISLDEDRIIHRLLDLISATLRTNYFQLDSEGRPKHYLSIKFFSQIIPELPLPIPLYEIFVYSPRFEAIHLRNTKVARGGIRWSDRREDFRTEVLGLMKAQTVKNAIIVPSGAKGGFVLKKEFPVTDLKDIKNEVITCYRLFIRGLLDLTDNIKDDKLIPPKDVVCHDEPDSYLVVAADKGTAAFSDIANDIAKEYDFWLGDAFASGGSTGYDHKKMGITARGAWESIKRHFRELNIDVEQEPISVVGIGDMSGDVFGNGMLYTKNIRLIAAFDHRNIFIDPDPDGEISYNERLRLFRLPASSWEDYNPKLISKGGGVFKRSIKSISVTPQMKQALGIEENQLSANEMIQAILKAPVALLYNGGIGTYIKASGQTAADVGDRTNDYCRVNGGELRCKVVGEGGNLGVTQLGRIEYAQKGGLINTDFIDNSGGVDCSDHEVNLKILLNSEVDKGNLTVENRNKLLASLTNEVANLVLKDNYQQALVMSITAFHAQSTIGLHTTYIKELESLNEINRSVEFLPSDKELIERKTSGFGLTRPELAILLAYTKIQVKHEILNSDIPEDAYLDQLLESAFPHSIRDKYRAALNEHRLRRDIIATQISNQMINKMGITFIYRTQMETGASIPEIVKACAVSSHIFGAYDLHRIIESLDFKIPMAEQYDMFLHIRNLINLSTRWFLQTNFLKGDLKTLIDYYSPRIQQLETLIPNLMSGMTKQYFSSLAHQFQKAGLPQETAKKIAAYRAIYTSLNIIRVASKFNFDLMTTAKVYFAGGERMNLVWFRDQIANDVREGHWNTLARLTLRDELDISQRWLTVAILTADPNEKDPDKLVNIWMTNNQRSLKRWEKLLSMLHESNNIDYTMFFIAIRELIGLLLINFHGKTYEKVVLGGV